MDQSTLLCWFVQIAPPKRRVKFYGALLLFIALLAGWYWLSREPQVDGSSLSTWLRYGVGSEGSEMEPVERQEIVAAIRSIGPRAIPVLLQKLDAREVAWKEKLSDFQNQAEWFPEWAKINFRSPDSEHEEAIFGFRVLGTQAVAALPELSKRLMKTNSAAGAAACLVQIGVPALPILRQGLRSEDGLVRRAVVYNLDGNPGWGSNPELTKFLLPELRLLLQDSSPIITSVASSLLVLHSSSNEAVTIAREGLRDSRPEVAWMTLSALHEFSLQGPFVPELSNLLAHRNWTTRQYATNILRRIDPVAAFALGVNTNPPPRRSNVVGNPRRGAARR